uniref:GRAS family transcription factor containing protein, expressed n=1 Tax=Oryza sativa subsp. japonica TaxID=39947 RepID=Q7XCD7_ORYSJ|nr:GRAS family transcription factor containing protein, expressed [Oryza sativa Japonica Group]
MAAAPAPKLPPFPAGGFVPALKPKAEAANDEAAAAVEQLAEAAKLAEAGDAFGAREILARLNYRLPAAPTAGTPLLRSAFYFKEALRLTLSPTGDAPAPSASTPYDVVVKLGAYKAFSEVSPVLQFAHLTCVQAVLDELGGAGCIHVLDFDIGMGEQWASLMQELAQLRPAAALKVTALVSPASHHPLELQLIHENLSGFAAELGVFFHFTVFNIDTLDPAELLANATAGDAVAVHLPVGPAHAAATPAVLRLVKRLGAKVVVSVDRGCDRSDLPFAAHLFHSFHSAVYLLESIDAVGTDPDTASKIERYLIHPAIEQCVVASHRAASAMDKAPPPPWRAAFAAAGFAPVQATTFAESQAESLLSKLGSASASACADAECHVAMVLYCPLIKERERKRWNVHLVIVLVELNTPQAEKNQREVGGYGGEKNKILSEYNLLPLPVLEMQRKGGNHGVKRPCFTEMAAKHLRVRTGTSRTAAATLDGYTTLTWDSAPEWPWHRMHKPDRLRWAHWRVTGEPQCAAGAVAIGQASGHTGVRDTAGANWQETCIVVTEMDVKLADKFRKKWYHSSKLQKRRCTVGLIKQDLKVQNQGGESEASRHKGLQISFRQVQISLRKPNRKCKHSGQTVKLINENCYYLSTKRNNLKIKEVNYICYIYAEELHPLKVMFRNTQAKICQIDVQKS